MVSLLGPTVAAFAETAATPLSSRLHISMTSIVPDKI